MTIGELFKTVALSSAIVAGGALAAGAATFSSCTGDGYDISGHVDHAIDCTISDDYTQDSVTEPLTVNDPPGFFDITDWSFVGKLGEDFGQDDEGASGSFDLTGLLSDGVTHAMLVFKSGRGTYLVGYLIDLTSDLAGDWDSPFTDPPFEISGEPPKDTSHISLYEAVAPIPLPAGGLLLLTGIGGIAALRRRRRKSA